MDFFASIWILAIQSLPVCLTGATSAGEDFVVQYRAVGIDRNDAAKPTQRPGRWRYSIRTGPEIQRYDRCLEIEILVSVYVYMELAAQGGKLKGGGTQFWVDDFGRDEIDWNVPHLTDSEPLSEAVHLTTFDPATP